MLLYEMELRSPNHIMQVGTTLDLRVILAMFLGTFASVVGFCLVSIRIIINIIINTNATIAR